MIETNLREISPPTAEPITLEQARSNLRIDSQEEISSPPDPLLEAENADLLRMIKAARRHAEKVTGRLLTDAVYEWRRPSFGCDRPFLELPVADVGQIDSVRYIDDAGAEQVIDATVYYFDDNPEAGRIWLLNGQAWPTPAYLPDAVRVRLRSRYGAVYSPPMRPEETTIQAMHLMIGHWWTNREAASSSEIYEVPMGAAHLLRLDRSLASLGV